MCALHLVQCAEACDLLVWSIVGGSVDKMVIIIMHKAARICGTL